MLQRLRTICLAAICLAGPLAPRLAAWSGPGHRLIAAIAWQQLDAGQRQRAVAVIRDNPSFAQFFEIPAEVRGTDLEDPWIFMQAAVWSDLVRGDGGEEYRHSTWHYINEPHFLSNADAGFFRYGVPANLSRIEWPDAERCNVIQALAKARRELDSSTTDAASKGLALCWLFHLVGDLHQPMHSAALFAEDQLPRGDRGGNLIQLLVVPQPIENRRNLRSAGQAWNLHSLWDRATPARTDDTAALLELAQGLIDAEDELGEAAAAATDPETWLRESHAVAGTHVYTEEVRAWVRARTRQEIDEGEGERLALSDGYGDQARQAARRRVVQAGYRLAAVLREHTGM